MPVKNGIKFKYCPTTNMAMITPPRQLRLRTEREALTVVCRVKPVDAHEEMADVSYDLADHSVTLTDQTKNSSKTFRFHHVYTPNVQQVDFFRDFCEPVLETAINGGKGSLIFSYGVTNSGKTHTILGSNGHLGMLAYLINRLEEAMQSEVSVAALQLYNEQFYSLTTREKLIPRELWGFYDFQDFKPDPVDLNQLHVLLQTFAANRSNNQTKLNYKSSRSHAIFKIQCRNVIICVVDLAGSERHDKAMSNFSEATSINKSLLCLGRCLQGLREQKGSNIPYRESKLTRVLMEYFNSQYRVFMIAHLNQAKDLLYENLKVLEYAALARDIKSTTISQAINSARRHYEEAQSEKRKKMSTARKQSMAANLSTAKSFNKKKHIIASAKSLSSSEQELVTNEDQTTSDEEDNGQEEEPEDNDGPLRIQLINQQFRKLKQQRTRDLYISKVMGSQEEFENMLNNMFEKEEKKDQKLLDDMRKWEYKSPIRTNSIASMPNTSSRHNPELDWNLIKTEMKNKLREQFMREKVPLVMCEQGTAIGESFRKNFGLTPAKFNHPINDKGIQAPSAGSFRSSDIKFLQQQTPIRPASSSLDENHSSEINMNDRSFIMSAAKKSMRFIHSSSKKLYEQTKKWYNFLAIAGKSHGQKLAKQNQDGFVPRRPQMSFIKLQSIVIGPQVPSLWETTTTDGNSNNIETDCLGVSLVSTSHEDNILTSADEQITFNKSKMSNSTNNNNAFLNVHKERHESQNYLITNLSSPSNKDKFPSSPIRSNLTVAANSYNASTATVFDINSPSMIGRANLEGYTLKNLIGGPNELRQWPNQSPEFGQFRQEAEVKGSNQRLVQSKVVQGNELKSNNRKLRREIFSQTGQKKQSSPKNQPSPKNQLSPKRQNAQKIQKPSQVDKVAPLTEYEKEYMEYQKQYKEYRSLADQIEPTLMPLTSSYPTTFNGNQANKSVAKNNSKGTYRKVTTLQERHFQTQGQSPNENGVSSKRNKKGHSKKRGKGSQKSLNKNMDNETAQELINNQQVSQVAQQKNDKLLIIQKANSKANQKVDSTSKQQPFEIVVGKKRQSKSKSVRTEDRGARVKSQGRKTKKVRDVSQDEIVKDNKSSRSPTQSKDRINSPIKFGNVTLQSFGISPVKTRHMRQKLKK